MSAPYDHQIADLEARMARAVAEEDFETAAWIRDELGRLRVSPEAAAASDLRRQVPGAMGLGTDQPGHAPPKGWVKPKKPDPMTAGRKPLRGSRR